MLRDPESLKNVSWFMYVPTHFNDALDIRKMTRFDNKQPYEVWTQGSNFSFKQGDVLYDHAEGYAEWDKAITQINQAIQVRAAMDVTPAKSGSPRFAGLVEFEILKPSSAKKQLEPTSRHSMTQDAFILYLISGRLE